MLTLMIIVLVCSSCLYNLTAKDNYGFVKINELAGETELFEIILLMVLHRELNHYGLLVS